MKKSGRLFITAALCVALSGCNAIGLPGSAEDMTYNETAAGVTVTDVSGSAAAGVEDNYEEINGDFTVVSDVENGFAVSGSTYTFTKAGVYTLSGVLDGNIVIEATDEDEIELELAGVEITSSTNSPIFASLADKVKITAKSDTYNVITDSRKTKTVDSEEQGEAAIYSKCDLTVKGKGTLVVSGNYNNGIHSSDDLTIKNVTIKVSAVNNAVKGNDGVKIESGEITLISTAGDGIKTESTDISSKGVQRGSVDIYGGNLDIYAACDGIDAAYDVNIGAASEGEEVGDVCAYIYTNTYSTYTTKADGDSYKGIKANNEINIASGTISVKAKDDAIHADYGATLENGSKGAGNVKISGGALTVQSGDDGIHADYKLDISGGEINVVNAHEGLEGTLIDVSGGKTVVYSTDDGVNAAKKISGVTPCVTVSGGYLDVTVPSGDVDGVDSNGNYVQTGGVVITRDGVSDTSGNMASIDADGSITVSGGTLVCAGPFPSVNASVPCVIFGSTAGMGMGGFGGFGGRGGRGGPGSSSSSSSVTFAAGTYSVSGTDITFTLSRSYTNLMIVSDRLSVGSSYTLSGGTTKTWTQSSLTASVN